MILSPPPRTTRAPIGSAEQTMRPAPAQMRGGGACLCNRKIYICVATAQNMSCCPIASNCARLFVVWAVVPTVHTTPRQNSNVVAQLRLPQCSRNNAMEKWTSLTACQLSHSAAAATLPPPAGKARAPAQSWAGEGRKENLSTDSDFFRIRKKRHQQNTCRKTHAEKLYY